MIFSVIVPASNEGRYIVDCLETVADNDLPQGWLCQLIIVANGCRDDTAKQARAFAARNIVDNLTIEVIETPVGNKPNALNLGDAAAQGDIRIYLDADIRMEPGLLAELVHYLSRPEPAYASGRMTVAPAKSAVSRAYIRIWTKLPFMRDAVPGGGLFAVNGAGRQRWDQFPDVMSDDTYARLHFTPSERHAVSKPFLWPLAEGTRNLVRVRRRQDKGVSQLAKLYPHLFINENKPKPALSELVKLCATDPAGFAVYSAISLATKIPALDKGFIRGR